MASQTFALTDAWDATNRYTASGETDIILSNVGGNSNLQFDLTGDDSPPAQDVGHRIKAGESRAMTLNDGERLWMRGQTTALLGT